MHAPNTMTDTYVILVHSKVNPWLDLRGIEITMDIEFVWIMQPDGEKFLHKRLAEEDEGIVNASQT